MSATPFESPAPIQRTKQKKKRRPTRTPKPITPGISRLCSPSPFLDRSSFKRKKLLFNSKNYGNSRSTSTSDSSTEYDDPNDSEYDINQDLNDQYDEYDDEEEQKEIKKDIKSITKTKRKECNTSNNDLINDIENLSINGNQSLLRNARCSMKTNKLLTPAKFKEKSAKTKSISDSNEKRKSSKATSNSVRITKSKRVFSKCHSFGKLLVPISECGSGCPLYRSKWKNEATVTKLMPLYQNEEFSSEENVDNALREYELHADIYRICTKHYGIGECPVVGIHGCVTLQHNDNKQYLAFVMPALHCNLAQFVNRYRRLSFSEAHMFLRSGLRFLKVLKSFNLIHNDIKPENVFISVGTDGDKRVKINKFVFGDFGCAALTTEEFPFGPLTGTVTMWDDEALGEKHGKEDGFSYENDLYGLIGCLLDGVYGASILEELLEEENPNWEETEWNQYTDLVRKCRRRMNTQKFMLEELNYMKCNDKILRIVLMQIGESRKMRMTLEQMIDLVHC